MAGRLAGKVAIVTGAASGIGQACARQFVAQGAKVIATDVDEAGLAATAEGLGEAIITRHQDVSDEDRWIAIVTETVSLFGGLNVLVNNAGIGRGSFVTDTTLDFWRKQFAINVEGVFLGAKHAIPAMVASGSGSIVNMSSVDAIMGAPMRVPYCATKGAVLSFTKALAMECCELGQPIRVNSVHPGPTATNIFASAIPNSSQEVVAAMGGGDGIAEYYLRNTPMKIFAAPDDIANACVFLASDESRFMTGTQMVVDGGFSAGKLLDQSIPAMG